MINPTTSPIHLTIEPLPDLDPEPFDPARDVWMTLPSGRRVSVRACFVPYLLRLGWTQEGGTT